MSRPNRWPTQVKVAVMALIVVGLAAVGARAATGSARGTDSAESGTTSTSITATIPTSATLTTGSAQLLAGVPVAALDSSHQYSRTGDFGTAWTDDNDDADGHNGCDTRNDILHRDLTAVLTRTGTHDCVVIAGNLADPYSGTSIAFTKARATAIQIDHVVPLHDAWELGAWSWSQQQRIDYANDPSVLLAVSGPLNESKGDRLADAWTPPNTGEWCDYAQRTVAIHAKYHLPVTAAERSALVGMLARC
jgi:hypothetical protein